MKTTSKWLILLCAFPILFMACGGGGGGSSLDGSEPNFSLSLTDAPGDYLNVFVTIDRIYAIVDDSEPYQLQYAHFDSPAVVEEAVDGVTVDLLQLANGETIEFALGNLPEGTLHQLRLIISAASLVAYEDDVGIDGPDDGDDITHVEAEFEVKVPSGAQSGIKLNPRNVEIQSGTLTSLTLDFDAAKSIVELGSTGRANRDYHFILKPVIFILEATQATPVDTETMAVGLNFPTGLQVVAEPGVGSSIGDGTILVANAGTAGENADTVLDIDISDVLPVDASNAADLNWQVFASSADTDPVSGEPLVSNPTGVAQYSELVWISNAASLIDINNADTVSELYTDQVFSTIFIDSVFPGLVAPSAVEFGGFAPDGSLADFEILVLQTNGDGSVAALDLKGGGSLVGLLAPGSFTDPSDVAFVPVPFAIDDPAGTAVGSLFVMDATENLMSKYDLTTTGIVGDAGTQLSATLVGVFDYTFTNEPAGIAHSPDSDRLYIANRSNGSIIAIQQSDGVEIDTFDTGLGADAINGIDVISTGTEDIIFLTNTAGNTDPSNDAPGVGMSTLERVVIPLP